MVRAPRRVFQRLLPDFLGSIVGLLSGTDGVGTSPAKAGPKPAPADRGCNFANRRRVGEIDGGHCEAEHLGALLTVAVYITPFLLIGLAAKIWIKRKGVDLSDVQAEGDPNRKRRPRFLLGIWRDEGRE